VIVISNQQGVGKRIMTEDALDQVDGEIRDQLLTASNAKLTHVYYCVHLASDNCDCRKPKPGMLLQAADEHGIDLANSVMIGDSLGDIATGIAAGVAETILLMSGATSIISPTALEARMRPTLIARDLLGAVKHLLENLDK
jgi:D-glycero-D-manno-heptose 1,7-bisphosphate phosphatase